MEGFRCGSFRMKVLWFTKSNLRTKEYRNQLIRVLHGSGWAVRLTIHLRLVPTLRMRGAMTSFPIRLHAVMFN